MEKRKIKDYIDELKLIKHHIPTQELEVGIEYHVPPIISISRMDILITEKEGNNSVKFKITSGGTENGEKTMADSSILSRFVVKKHPF